MSSWETEYKALREEIVKRIELRQHVLLATLTIAAAFIGFSIKENNAIVALVYPIIATFLYISWSQSDSRIGDLAKYIHGRYEKSESCTNYPWWEHHMEEIRGGGGGLLARIRLITLSGGGMFLSTQFIAILVGILGRLRLLGGRTDVTPPVTLPPFKLFLVFLIISVLSFIFSLLLIHMRRPRRLGQ